MVLLGLGFYIPYVAFHTIVFERMIAVYREGGTVVYLMNVADAFGYSGYAVVLLLFSQQSTEVDFLGIMNGIAFAVSVLSIVILIGMGVYFLREMRCELSSQHRPAAQELSD